MNKLIIIGGPTGVGKTAASVELAKRINGQIISADSMQVYKGCDIGTAKITTEEMAGIKHYGIDCLETDDQFNVVYFKKMAQNAIREIYNNNCIPIIVGGTGFYIQSVLYNIDFENSETDEKLRSELQKIADEKGNDYLHEMLNAVDPESAKLIHANNVKRVIRAIEYFKTTGRKISVDNEIQSKKESPYDYKYFAITDNRELLYERIDKRVDVMIKSGLEQEIRNLINRGINSENLCMQGIGYKEMYEYIQGNISLDDAIANIKQNSRRYAKRQLTWLRREQDVIWLDRQIYKSNDMLVSAMINAL